MLVTGATSGIGRASALLFARGGARVALIGRRSTEGEQVAAEIAQAGGTVLFIQADLADFDAIAPALEKVVARFGRLDGVFNNAGVGGGRNGIEARTAKEWDTLFDVNFKSAFFCLQAQVAQMRRQGGGGAILFNASVLASVGYPGTMMYAASKGGLVSLARGAAVELGPEGIRVNTVSPSITRTPMTEVGFTRQADGTEQHPIAAMTPLRRVVEIAYAAAFLLSDRAAFITGHDLAVDGGLSAA